MLIKYQFVLHSYYLTRLFLSFQDDRYRRIERSSGVHKRRESHWKMVEASPFGRRRRFCVQDGHCSAGQSQSFLPGWKHDGFFIFKN